MSRTATAVADATAIALRTLTILLLLGAVVWLGSGIRRVEPGSWVVVTRFGAVVRDQGPGLLLAWPRPLEDSLVVPGPALQLSLKVDRLAALTDAALSTSIALNATKPLREDSYVLSGDAGMAHVQATVVYTITDARRWFLQRDHVEPALRRMTCDTVVTACAARPLEGVLVASVDARGDQGAANAAAGSREQLRQEVALGLQRSADHVGLGIGISRVDLQVTLPRAARDAFAKVVASDAAAATDIATARTDAERQRQEAATLADRIHGQATARARELLRDALVVSDVVRSYHSQPDPEQRALLITRVWRERLDVLVRRAGATTALAPDSPAMALPGLVP